MGPRKLRLTRWFLLLLVAVLTGVGILFVHSTTTLHEPFPNSSARSQMLKAVVALVVLFTAASVDYRRFDRFAYAFYALMFAILVGMVGIKVATGSTMNRSISLAWVQVQPSELMKVALILALARYLRFREDQHSLLGLVIPFLMTFVPMGLVVLQPDLGTSLIFPPILLGMLLVAGAKRRHLAAVILFGGMTLLGAYSFGDHVPFLRKSSWGRYQRERIEAFLNRDETTRSSHGWQLAQSEIAIGSGGLLGKGFGQGPQNLGRFVPEKQTDFIFSIIAEEWGFVGAASVVVGFVLLVFVVLRVSLGTREPFGRLTTAGVGVAFAVQSAQNLGMTLGLTPITGLPLPFISFGGSSLVTSFLAVGIVYGIASRPVRVMASQDLNPRVKGRSLSMQDDLPAGQLQGRWAVE